MCRGHVCAVVSHACKCVNAPLLVTGRVWGGAIVACRVRSLTRGGTCAQPSRCPTVGDMFVMPFCASAPGGACPDGAAVVVDDCSSTASRCTIADDSGSRRSADVALTTCWCRSPAAVHLYVALAVCSGPAGRQFGHTSARRWGGLWCGCFPGATLVCFGDVSVCLLVTVACVCVFAVGGWCLLPPGWRGCWHSWHRVATIRVTAASRL